MEVQNPTNLNLTNNKIYSINPKINKYVRLSFTGRNDQFVRATEDAFEITGQKRCRQSE